VHVRDSEFALYATDLSNFLGCRHRTALDMGLALGKRTVVTYEDPLLELLIRRGLEHEQRFVDALSAGAATVVNVPQGVRDDERVVTTLQAMHQGADVIVQGGLRHGTWNGRPDVMLRVSTKSGLGDWSYEVYDTKLARETKAGTILQLCLYSELLASAQEARPEHFHVITPDSETPQQKYRFADYAAYFRLVRRQMGAAMSLGDDRLADTYYPEPVDMCGACRWSSTCSSKRRGDDHLSLVSGISRAQRQELEARSVRTLTQLAGLPEKIGFKPRRGSVESYERVRDQARLQLSSRDATVPTYEMLEIEAEFGLARLPEPTPGDLFLDLEGDPMLADHGREYLFGIATADGDYHERWAFTDADERRAFEWAMDAIVERIRAYPDMHVYHYAPYEPSAFKRLMGRYATRQRELDELLRARRFVDLYAVVRQSMRVGVERYSIKSLEPLYDFTRGVPLEDANKALRALQYALGAGVPDSVPDDVRAAIVGYNRDDCVSTRALRDWLETLRARAIAAGASIARPIPDPAGAPPDIDERAKRVEKLRGRLLAGLPELRGDRDDAQQARWLLAYMLDYHRREDNVAWWEFFRLVEMPEEDLIDERAAVAGLDFAERVRHIVSKKGRPTGSVVDRYRYPAQEMEIEVRDNVSLQDKKPFGKVVAVDRKARTIDVRKGPSRAETHPTAMFEFTSVPAKAQAEAMLRIGDAVASGSTEFAAARALLSREPPRFRDPALTIEQFDPANDLPSRLADEIDETLLAIQGPPGAGKTYLAAETICRLVQRGKRVGVTATSHKVIRNLLDAVAEAANRLGATASLGHRVDDDDVDEDAPDGEAPALRRFGNAESARDALANREVSVVGGTAWLWTRPDLANAVDVLFVDEAGQMSLANAVTVSQAARSLVLLGDPQQLEQPRKGSHPEGVDVSALEHILGPDHTMPRDRGIFLAVTHRLAPSICDFTSEVFYDNRLGPLAGLELQRISVTGGVPPVGLSVLDVQHDGNRNHSPEEVEAVASLVQKLIAPGATWTDKTGRPHPLDGTGVLVVAPYNAHVNRLLERLAEIAPSVRVGTVDKFQGQEAPVVIYSMATSRAEDAPRGMEFLFSLNRLNVATSRARCLAVLVASPRMYEAECRTPRQMQLANALCRYREMATPIALP
jgi:uncharacterized protein